MTAPPALLLLSISIGVPLMLLALGVLYHAYVLGQQPAVLDHLEEHVQALATESADALLIDLQETVERMQGQLARQRQSLADLLSDEGRRTRAPVPALATASAGFAADPELPMAAGVHVATARPAAAPRRVIEDSRRATAANPLGAAVAQLVSEGLSDRSIARRLHIGLEEVRMTRMRVGR